MSNGPQSKPVSATDIPAPNKVEILGLANKVDEKKGREVLHGDSEGWGSQFERINQYTPVAVISVNGQRKLMSEGDISGRIEQLNDTQALKMAIINQAYDQKNGTRGGDNLLKQFAGAGGSIPSVDEQFDKLSPEWKTKYETLSAANREEAKEYSQALGGLHEAMTKGTSLLHSMGEGGTYEDGIKIDAQTVKSADEFKVTAKDKVPDAQPSVPSSQILTPSRP